MNIIKTGLIGGALLVAVGGITLASIHPKSAPHTVLAAETKSNIPAQTPTPSPAATSSPKPSLSPVVPTSTTKIVTEVIRTVVEVTPQATSQPTSTPLATPAPIPTPVPTPAQTPCPDDRTPGIHICSFKISPRAMIKASDGTKLPARRASFMKSRVFGTKSSKWSSLCF